MNSFKLFLTSFLFVSSINAQPNVIIILTDDLGWGDVSYHGGSIPTPNIDKLVSKGVEMNRFYSDPSCSPTRASICLLYTSPSPRDATLSRMPSSA